MNQVENHTPNQPSPTPAPPLIKWGWLRALIFLIVAIVYLIAMNIVTFLGFSITSVEELIMKMTEPSMTLFALFQISILMLIIYLFRKFIDNRSVVSLGFSLKKPYVKDLIIGSLWGIGMICLVFGILWITGSISIVKISWPVKPLLFMIIPLVVAAAQEEIILRGYVLNNLMKSANKYLSLVVVSIFFSLSHAFNPNVSTAGLINIVLAGLLLGVYYIYRKNLWFPIGLHFTWNYFQGAIFGSPISGINAPSIIELEFHGSDLLTGGDFGFEASWVSTGVLLAVIIAHHFIYKDKDTVSPENPPRNFVADV